VFLSGPPSFSTGFPLFSAGVSLSALTSSHLFCRVLYFILCFRVSLSPLTDPPYCSAGFPLFYAAAGPESSDWPSLLFGRVSFILCCRVSLSALTGPPSCSCGTDSACQAQQGNFLKFKVLKTCLQCNVFLAL